MHVCSCLNAAFEEPSIYSPDCRIGDILLPRKPFSVFAVFLYSQVIVYSKIFYRKRVTSYFKASLCNVKAFLQYLSCGMTLCCRRLGEEFDWQDYWERRNCTFHIVCELRSFWSLCQVNSLISNFVSPYLIGALVQLLRVLLQKRRRILFLVR